MPSTRPVSVTARATQMPQRPQRRRFLLGACAASLVAACGERRAPRAAIELVFTHGKLFGDPVAMRALLDEFERRHPGVAVREQTLPASSDDQHQFYALNLHGRSSALDVLAADVIWIAGFARAGWLRDASALLPPERRPDFFAGPLDAATWRGSLYAVPWYVDAGVLYYRKDLLEQNGFGAPGTWSELVAIAQTVTAREPGYLGFVWQGKQYEGLVCNALEYLCSNGGGVLENGRVAVDSAANREALGFMADLVQRFRVTPAWITTATEEPSRHVFGQGRAVFLRNWPYAMSLFGKPGSRVAGKVGVAVLPCFPGGSPAATLGGWHLAVNAQSRHPAEAEQLVAFLTSAEAQKALALGYGFQPSRVALYRDRELLAAEPLLPTLEQVFASARPRPVTPLYIRVSQVLQSEFSAAIAGLKRADGALTSAQTLLERVIAHAQ